MKKKLALACALLHRPQILLLDEPTTGVDPVARRDFWDLLSQLHGQGITAIVTTPYMDEAERCNRVVLLFEGRVLAQGTPQEIKARVPGSVLSVRDVNIHQAEHALAGHGWADRHADLWRSAQPDRERHAERAQGAKRAATGAGGTYGRSLRYAAREHGGGIHLSGECGERKRVVNHYRAIVRKEFYQIVRDPGTLILLTLGPVFLLLVFVFMLTSDVRDVPTAVVDLSDNAASQHLIATLDSAPEIHITAAFAERRRRQSAVRPRAKFACWSSSRRTTAIRSR